MAFSTDKTRQAASGNGGAGTEGFIVGRKSTTSSAITGVSFASSGPTEDWGDLSLIRSTSGIASDTTHSYLAGGSIGSGIHYTRIDRFSFASAGNSTNVGDLTFTRSGNVGMQTSTRGFSVGGSAGYATFTYNSIEAYAFSSSSNSYDWGDTLNLNACSGGIGWFAGCYSSTNGHIMGGYTPCGGNWYNVSTIQRFSLSSSSNASSWAQMNANGGSAQGVSSASYGYNVGGTWGNVYRISFSSGGTASSWCNLVSGRDTGGGGITRKGDDVLYSKGQTGAASLDKFSMASTSTAVGWGDLTGFAVNAHEPAGTVDMGA